jgi:hypothetical protein
MLASGFLDFVSFRLSFDRLSRWGSSSDSRENSGGFSLILLSLPL